MNEFGKAKNKYLFCFSVMYKNKPSLWILLTLTLIRYNCIKRFHFLSDMNQYLHNVFVDIKTRQCSCIGEKNLNPWLYLFSSHGNA